MEKTPNWPSPPRLQRIRQAQLGPWQLLAGGTLSYSYLPLQGSPMSHSSHLLISLLLSIGVGVIGYFTHVRVELAEGKGQATRLSVACTTAIHQLLSSGTRKATAALSRHFVKTRPGLPGQSINVCEIQQCGCALLCTVDLLEWSFNNLCKITYSQAYT